MCDTSARNFGESADGKLKKWGVSTNKKTQKLGCFYYFLSGCQGPLDVACPPSQMWSSCEAPVGGEFALCVCVHPQSVLAGHLSFCESGESRQIIHRGLGQGRDWFTRQRLSQGFLSLVKEVSGKVSRTTSLGPASSRLCLARSSAVWSDHGRLECILSLKHHFLGCPGQCGQGRVSTIKPECPIQSLATP